ncbi:testis-expressed protein 43-like [Megalops cyprinoides]|uniref:testis-expressed protein 43-like n=1 Tax=Megalops cyprinoides TaxID=118141 RepID=UPI001864F1F8|nr:testis-expressed protein 43-like [Megalops cyprinoides]
MTNTENVTTLACATEGMSCYPRCIAKFPRDSLESTNMAKVSANTAPKKTMHLHVPAFSVKHPMIPKLYVMPWKQDMKNQRLLLKNAALAQIPHGPQEESLCWEGRERMCHGQARTGPLDSTVQSPPQPTLPPPNASHLSRYNSSLVTTRGLYGYGLP